MATFSVVTVTMVGCGGPPAWDLGDGGASSGGGGGGGTCDSPCSTNQQCQSQCAGGTSAVYCCDLMNLNASGMGICYPLSAPATTCPAAPVVDAGRRPVVDAGRTTVDAGGRFPRR